MHINCTVSRSGIFYRGVATVKNDDNVCVDQKLSSHERLSRIDALRDADSTIFLKAVSIQQYYFSL